jgi:hypothetical protein
VIHHKIAEDREYTFFHAEVAVLEPVHQDLVDASVDASARTVRGVRPKLSRGWRLGRCRFLASSVLPRHETRRLSARAGPVDPTQWLMHRPRDIIRVRHPRDIHGNSGDKRTKTVGARRRGGRSRSGFIQAAANFDTHFAG